MDHFFPKRKHLSRIFCYIKIIFAAYFFVEKSDQVGRIQEGGPRPYHPAGRAPQTAERRLTHT
jgi:hypothetical protein